MTSASSRRPLGSVLVATDFSEGSRLALERATVLPLEVGARIELLNVLHGEHDTSAVEQMAAGAKRLLEDARQAATRMLKTGSSQERDVFVCSVQGKPFVEIIRNARNGRAELIVVGRHGERKFRDMAIGSTAERVVRKGDVSVLVVATVPAGTYQRPLVALDMSDSSRHALELALRICDPTVDRIAVVHVVSPPSAMYLSDPVMVPDIDQLRVDKQQRAQSELSEFLGKLRAGVEWDVVLRSGDARQAILEEAKSRGSDLIVLGTKGRTGLPHLLIGSVAEGVLRAAPCDVLVARLPSADFRMP